MPDKHTEKTILAIDQGTTSSRAILFSQKGESLAIEQKELPQIYPHKGWVEQDAHDILNDTLWCLRHIVSRSRHDLKSCAAIGITNQRETTIIWDRRTGKPIYNAIVWQDRRSADFMATLKEKGLSESIRNKTGLLLDPYFSASKIAWILNNVDGAHDAAQAGHLAFGTVDSFLIWHLTGGERHVTCATNASRSLLFNIIDQKWDDELCQIFNIPMNMLPDVLDNADDFGMAKGDLFGLPAGHDIPICGVAGDQHAAMIGQACFQPGMVKSTYGTGCFALMNMGSQFTLSQNQLLTTLAYRLNGKVTYALEGSIFIAGAAIQWLRDNLHLFTRASETQDLAQSVPDNNGVYFVPAFTGLGAPYWRPDAQAAILGLTRESNFAHIARAALEAQAYQSHDLFTAMNGDIDMPVDLIRADGGLVANEFMCQFLADILNLPVDIPHTAETTALGAAYLAGLGYGIYNSLDDITAQWSRKTRYTPTMNDTERQSLLSGWHSAINRIIQ